MTKGWHTPPRSGGAPAREGAREGEAAHGVLFVTDCFFFCRSPLPFAEERRREREKEKRLEEVPQKSPTMSKRALQKSPTDMFLLQLERKGHKRSKITRDRDRDVSARHTHADMFVGTW